MKKGNIKKESLPKDTEVRSTETKPDPKKIRVEPGNIPTLTIQLLNSINISLKTLIAEIRHQRLEK